MPSLRPLLDAYLAGPRLLREAIAGLTPEQVVARPVAGRWSTLEVVCHLADFEPIFADRVKRVLAEESPTLVGADETRFAAALAYHARDLDEELTLIAATRGQLGRILQTAPDTAFARTGVHTERGPVTLEQLLTMATNHLVHHVRFLHEKRAALGVGT